MEHLVGRWNVPSLTGLTPEAAQAQEYVCSLPARFRKLAERKEARLKRGTRTKVAFSWLHDRELLLLP
jgi:acyl-[acyl-carrier-protein] desaturase